MTNLQVDSRPPSRWTNRVLGLLAAGLAALLGLMVTGPALNGEAAVAVRGSPSYIWTVVLAITAWVGVGAGLLAFAGQIDILKFCGDKVSPEEERSGVIIILVLLGGVPLVALYLKLMGH